MHSSNSRGLSLFAHCGFRFTIRLRPDNFCEPPRADPHAGWCGEGRLITVPYPIGLPAELWRSQIRNELFAHKESRCVVIGDLSDQAMVHEDVQLVIEIRMFIRMINELIPLAPV